MGNESSSYRERVYEHAIDAHGYVTTKDAAEIGVPAVELRKLASRGFLDRVGHGVYRVGMIPRSDRDEFAEAVELVGEDAYLRADTVLALLNLAPVNTRAIRVGTPHRVRRSLPREVEVVHEELPAADLTEYEGIRSSRIERALLDSRGIVMVDRLNDATDRAQREGYLSASAARAVREQLRRGNGVKESTVRTAKGRGKAVIKAGGRSSKEAVLKAEKTVAAVKGGNKK
ncbi:type IV toxin-antitoxin system AbiEi family antitoxin domain-containing protein [Cellulomonas fengjieae]|uniref:type IV toxin-antitoxin system AbiEi family antitoxin domain-containing protein n=1 Tax=Cellulomonas fengjieae TaxID=2819978 RepID=UPI001AAEFD08|nr:type IV toxin-antitoxin system AbiEi family antitoxin domain-containing protein [Cellulomonas fengjieae]MBO3100618.1 type IV toxin-antitoxin system AbiEi family antitoxin domain-containing protein [Cellulomonas fengjieae]